MAEGQEPAEPVCSFCGKSRSEVRRLIAGREDQAFICDECVSLAMRVNADLAPLRRALNDLIALARKRGHAHVTCDELNAALPPEELSADEIEEFMTKLAEQGIVVVEE
jgi:ATP:corrinoid adenosyltransferase